MGFVVGVCAPRRRCESVPSRMNQKRKKLERLGATAQLDGERLPKPPGAPLTHKKAGAGEMVLETILKVGVHGGDIGRYMDAVSLRRKV
jgi:hypothetical protein